MPFATLDDVNMHLPTDKLEMKQPKLDLMGIDAERIIRGYLSNVFTPLILAGWTDPEEDDPAVAGYVPELIKSIAGRFIAAFYYRERYSEDSLDDPQYAQMKYDEAMGFINQLIAGTIALVDVDLVATSTSDLTSDDFYPNDTDSGPMFTVDDKLFNVESGRTGLGVSLPS